jgi:hypothetical protein
MYGTYFLLNIMTQQHILGMSTKLWKATINFVISVCLSAWNYSVPTGTDFHEIDMWVFFENLLRKLKLH